VDPARIALFAAALPAAVAVAVLVVFRVAGLGESAAAVACAVAGGYAAGHVGLGGLPALIPVDKAQWLPHLAVLGAVVGIVESCRNPLPPWLRWSIRVAAALFAAWASVLDRSPLWIGGVAAAVAAVFFVLDGTARRPLAPPLLFTLAVVATAAAAALVVSGTMAVGERAGAMAAACGACFVASRRRRVDARGAVVPAGLLLAALLLNGVLLADLPVAAAVLLAIAPLAAWLPGVPGGSATRGPWAVVSRSAWVVALAGAGVALAVHASPPLDY